MAPFDIENVKQRLNDRSTGYILAQNSSYNEAQKLGALANSAYYFLRVAIDCFLVGYDDVAETLEVIPKPSLRG